MESKIKTYVDYQFRFKNDKESMEAKEEILANLTDRYYENLEKYQDENKAYVDTIKQMGDFGEENGKKEYSIKPSLIETTFIVATVFSIFGLLILFLSTLIGIVFTSISIAFYACGAYYLYAQAKFVKNENKDIEEHNILLTKIIKYLKTNYIFWAINIVIILASIISSIFNGLFVVGGVLDPSGTMIYIILAILIYIILIIILLYVMYVLHKRIMDKYKYMTGNSIPKSHINDSIQLLKKEGETKEKIKFNIKELFLKIFNIKYVYVISLIVILFSFLSIENIEINYMSGNQIQNITLDTPIELLFRSVTYINNLMYIDYFAIIYIIFLIITSVIGIFKKVKSNKFQLIALYGWVIVYSLFILLFISSSMSIYNVYLTNYIIILYLSVVLIVLIGIIKVLIKKSNNEEQKNLQK